MRTCYSDAHAHYVEDWENLKIYLFVLKEMEGDCKLDGVNVMSSIRKCDLCDLLVTNLTNPIVMSQQDHQ